ncbi:hypothetical protein [Arthrobacter pigmenti]
MEHRQPSAAEVARTLLTGVGTATLGSAATQNAVPVLHAETMAGAFILVGDGHTLAGLGLDSPVSDLLYRELCPIRDLAGPQSNVGTAESSVCVMRYPVTLDISSMAPVADMNIERSSARFSGTVTPLPAAAVPAALQAECSGVRLGEVLGYRPDAKLFTFLPGHATLTDGGGKHELDIHELLGIVPDPLARWEGPLLRSIEGQYASGVLNVVRGLDASIDTESLGIGTMSTVESVRIIGVDQYGLTLQCHWDATACIWRALSPDDGQGRCPGQAANDDGGGCLSTTAVIRAPFSEPASTSDAVLLQVQAMVQGAVPAV